MMKGRYELPQVSIRMIKEAPLMSDIPFETPMEVVEVMSRYLEIWDREVVCVVNLQSDLRPINMSIVAIGSLDCSMIAIRDVVKSSILSNAAYMTIFHNHPSGKLRPSTHDILFTSRLIQAGDLVDIPLVDHVIVGKNGEHYSFYEQHKMEKPQRNYAKHIGELRFSFLREEKAHYHSSDENPIGKKMDDIMKSLETGLQAFLDGDAERYKCFLQVMSKFHRYSINNQMLIALQDPEATLVNSFDGWKKVKRYVRKAEKGIRIICPVKTKVRKMTEDGEEKEEEKLTFKPSVVFDLRQTDGEELPLQRLSELKGSVENYERLIQSLIKCSPVDVFFENFNGDAKGFYSSVGKKIVVKLGMDEKQTAKTLIHEIAHAICDAEGLDKGADRYAKETKAESIAYVVSKAYDIDTSSYSFGYLGSWSKEHDTKELRENLSQIRTVSSYLIKEIQDHMLES